MSKTYKSEALAAVHEMMEGFYESGAIDKQTMREFDEGCLTTVQPLTPEEIRSIRERERISQPVFARYLNDHGQWLLPIPVIRDGQLPPEDDDEGLDWRDLV